MKDLIAMYRRSQGLEPEPTPEPTPEFDTLDETSQKVEQAFVREEVEELRQTWERTGNAAHVWRAYRLLRETWRPVPAWILDYMYDAAGKLSAASTPQEVTEALGYKGTHKGNTKAQEQYLDTAELLQIYLVERDRMERNAPGCCKTAEEIFQRVYDRSRHKKHASQKAVKRALLGKDKNLLNQ